VEEGGELWWRSDELSDFQPGDEIAIMLPNCMQTWGLARNRGKKQISFFFAKRTACRVFPWLGCQTDG
jgi:hypothetical protein